MTETAQPGFPRDLDDVYQESSPELKSIWPTTADAEMLRLSTR